MFLIAIIFSILFIPLFTGLNFVYAVSNHSTTWYGEMTINLFIPEQAIKISSTGTGPFSFIVKNDGTVSGTGSITQNVKVSGIYKGTICNGTGLYVWNYNIGGHAYQDTDTANMIFTFISSNVSGNISCQGGGITHTIPLNNSPVSTFDPQNIQINLNQGVSVDSQFLGIGDLKIELTGTNSSSVYSIPKQQQSIVQPTLNFSTPIPEFDSVSSMILAVSLILVISVVTSKFKK